MEKEDLIKFVSKIIPLWEQGKIRTPIHIPGGNETQLLEYFTKVKPDDYVFSTWRSWYHFLLKTGDEDFLYNKIVNEGNSMHIIDLSRKFISTAIVGGNCAPAVGVAKGIRLRGGVNWVHCFVGDGCTDEGWFWEALRYAINLDLPITFVIEWNNRSVATDYKTRWGCGVDPFIEFIKKSKKVYFYKYIPTYPHVGTGKFITFM